MSADRRPAMVSVGLGLLTLVALLAAPVGVMLGQNAIEMAVVGIAGVGLAVLHLAVVVDLRAGELIVVRSVHHIVSVGGGGGGGGRGGSSAGGSGSVGPSSGGGAGGRGNAGRPPG